jgi:hypothetical protein
MYLQIDLAEERWALHAVPDLMYIYNGYNSTLQYVSVWGGVWGQRGLEGQYLGT